jgi:hypothetical protein
VRGFIPDGLRSRPKPANEIYLEKSDVCFGGASHPIGDKSPHHKYFTGFRNFAQQLQIQSYRPGTSLEGSTNQHKEVKCLTIQIHTAYAKADSPNPAAPISSPQSFTSANPSSPIGKQADCWWQSFARHMTKAA